MTSGERQGKREARGQPCQGQRGGDAGERSAAPCPPGSALVLSDAVTWFPSALEGGGDMEMARSPHSDDVWLADAAAPRGSVDGRAGGAAAG